MYAFNSNATTTDNALQELKRKGPEVQGGSVETNLLFYFSDLYCEHSLFLGLV